MPQTLPTAVSSALEFEDFFSTTLKEPLLATDTDVYLNRMPISVESFLVIDPKGDNPEIIFYNAVGGDYVRCPSATEGQGRGVFNTNRQEWDADTVIGMYSVAAFFEAIVTGKALRAATSMPVGALVPFGGAAAPAGWLLCDGSSVLQADYAALYAVVANNFGPADATHFTLPDMRGRTPLGAGARTWALTIAAANVDAAGDQLVISSDKNVYTGKAVVLTTSSSAPGGLTAGTTYYVISVDSTHIKLATSHANAVAGTAINITSQGAGTHTLTFTGANHILAETGGEDNHSLVANEMPAHHHTFTWGQGGYTAGGNTAMIPFTFDHAENTSDTGGSASHNVLNPYTALNYIIKT